MPHYDKFMKDILRRKRKIVEEGAMNLIATYSAVIQRSLPVKMHDLDVFTIPCTIGILRWEKYYVILEPAST